MGFNIGKYIVKSALGSGIPKWQGIDSSMKN
jgi:hypothetical protein